MSIKLTALLAGLSGMCASVEAGIPMEPGTLEALGRWPVTVILGVVCVTCVYFMYKQSKDNADWNAKLSQENSRAFLSMVEGERLATEHRIANNLQATKNLAENNAKVVKDLAENNAKVVRELAENNAANMRSLLAELKERHAQ